MDGASGKSLPVFDMFDNAGDLVETAFLMEGLLTARQYFRGPSAREKELYENISYLWNTVEWDWYRRSPQSDALYWHWSPDFSWHINHRITGFNEAMIIYLLAIASPQRGVCRPLLHRMGGRIEGGGRIIERIGRIRRKESATPTATVTKGSSWMWGWAAAVLCFFAHYSYMGFDPHISRSLYGLFREQPQHGVD